MGHDVFAFRQFLIRQDRCAMKVGTDGVLLGAWAECPCPARCLDVGTGTSVIALMLAQRFSDAIVDAIDVDGEACRQAFENVSESPFADRVRVIESSLQAFEPLIAYDLIVSNPPYFVNSLKNPDRRRSLARHADTLSYADLFKGVGRLLADGGVFSAIVPAESIEQFCGEASLSGLFLIRKCGVKTTEKKPVKRYLLAFSRHRSGTFEEEDVCLSDESGERSSWYRKITDSFYLR
ncbi:MAG: methyltransferase [Prevotella sp.]|nr:methyltransferase [Prevotella sp.]